MADNFYICLDKRGVQNIGDSCNKYMRIWERVGVNNGYSVRKANGPCPNKMSSKAATPLTGLETIAKKETLFWDIYYVFIWIRFIEHAMYVLVLVCYYTTIWIFDALFQRRKENIPFSKS